MNINSIKQYKIYLIITAVFILIIGLLLAFLISNKTDNLSSNNNSQSNNSTTDSNSEIDLNPVSIAQRGARDNKRMRDLLQIRGSIEDYMLSQKIHQYPEFSQLKLNSNSNTIEIGANGNLIQIAQTTLVNLKSDIKLDANGKVSECNVKKASKESWEIGYKVASDGNSLYLCTILENGKIFEISSSE
jgi:hypothetical protein